MGNMRCGFGQVMDTAFYLFLSSPLLTFMQLFLLALFNLSIHLSVSASPLLFLLCLSLSLSLFLYQSAPLRVIYGFISSRSFCQNKITICAIEQKLDGFDPKRKKERKKGADKKISAFFLFSFSSNSDNQHKPRLVLSLEVKVYLYKPSYYTAYYY